MSLDYTRIPASIEQDAVQYAKSRNISPEEAFVEIFSNGLKATRTKSKEVAPLTDEELANLERLCPALKLLDDVTDETWNQIAVGARQMNEEGFENRA